MSKEIFGYLNLLILIEDRGYNYSMIYVFLFNNSKNIVNLKLQKLRQHQDYNHHLQNHQLKMLLSHTLLISLIHQEVYNVLYLLCRCKWYDYCQLSP